MMIFSARGSKESLLFKYIPHGVPTDDVSEYHNMSVYGMQFTLYENIERAFLLPTYDRFAYDVFDPIKLFTNEWKNNMAQARVAYYGDSGFLSSGRK